MGTTLATTTAALVGFVVVALRVRADWRAAELRGLAHAGVGLDAGTGAWLAAVRTDPLPLFERVKREHLSRVDDALARFRAAMAGVEAGLSNEVRSELYRAEFLVGVGDWLAPTDELPLVTGAQAVC